MNAEILEIVKTLLGIEDDSQDKLLSLNIEMTVQSVLNYCNIYEIPKELVFEVAKIVVDSHKNASGTNEAPIASIKEGDRSVSFYTGEIQRKMDDNLKRMTQLNRFRKLYKY